MATETTAFNIQDHLATTEDQVAYIQAALEEGDPDFLAIALGDIARARGVSKFAEEAGLSREAIYKAFRKGGNPTITTLSRAMRVLGLRLTAVANGPDIHA